MSRSRAATITALIACVFALASCASKESATHFLEEESDFPDRPEITLAKGWKKVELNTLLYNSTAKMTLEISGHYHSDWAVCTRRPEGIASVMETSDWEIVGGVVNEFVNSARLAQPQCFPYKKASDYDFSDEAWVYLENEKLTLLKVEGSWDETRLCTTLPSVERAKQLVETINRLTKATAVLDCQSHGGPPGN